MKQLLGSIVSGSLVEGLVMRISPQANIEDIKTGKFVSVEGSATQTFFSLITDLSLEVTHSDILLFPPSSQETLLNEVLKQKDIYATATLKPMLMLNNEQRPIPVKTIPPHFSSVYEATKEDVALIFGDEHDASKNFFNIGCPLDMETPGMS